MSEKETELLSWDDVHQACKHLSLNIRRKYPSNLPIPEVIVGIARGGLIPATLIAHILGSRRIISIQAESYADKDTESHSLSLHIPSNLTALAGDRPDIIFIDDLVDTGHTMAAIADLFPLAFRCSVYAKPAGRHSVHCTAIAKPQDVWLSFPWERV